MFPLCRHFFECGHRSSQSSFVSAEMPPSATSYKACLPLERCDGEHLVDVFFSIPPDVRFSFICFRRVRDLAARMCNTSFQGLLFTACCALDGLVSVTHGSHCFLEQCSPATISKLFDLQALQISRQSSDNKLLHANPLQMEMISDVPRKVFWQKRFKSKK